MKVTARLSFYTSMSDLDLYSRTQEWEKAKPFGAFCLQKFSIDQNEVWSPVGVC